MKTDMILSKGNGCFIIEYDNLRVKFFFLKIGYDYMIFKSIF